MKRLAYRISAALCLLSALAAVFFYTKVRERRAEIGSLIERVVEERGLERRADIAIAMSEAIYRETSDGIEMKDLSLYDRLESTSFFNVTSAVALKHHGFGILGHDVYGPCGTMTRITLNALWQLGIPARKLQLLPNARGQGGGHTMIEFMDDDGRWCVLSPSDSTFVWRNREGAIATVAEIQNDREVFAQIYERYPEYPYLFDNPMNIRWEKLPKAAQGVLRMVMGPEAFRKATTPRLYDLPRDLFLIVSASACVLFGLLALTFRRLKSETMQTAEAVPASEP
jgi:hypothetical protein